MLNKLCKILFIINIFIIALQSHAALPALPPSSSPPEINTEDKQATSDSSIFDTFKQFFRKSPKKAPPSESQPQQTKQNDAETSKLVSQEPNQNEASEPFMDTGSTPLPSAANNDLPDNEAAHDGSTNLASNNIAGTQLPVTPNVPRPLVTMPPLRPGSYVVPPSQPVQVYKPTNLPPVRIPTPLNPPPNAPNNTPAAVPAPAVTPPTPNTPPVSVPATNSPVAPNNVPAAVTAPAVTPLTPNTPPVSVPATNSPVAPNNVPAAVPAPAVTPPTPNMPPVPVPVTNSPVAPNTTPNNLPASQPVTTPPNPLTPAVPVTAPPVTTTDSSTESDNSQQTITASVNSSEKQNWDTSLKPVEVLAVNQSQNSNKNTSSVANQTPPQNMTPLPVKKEGNNIIHTEVTESAAKFAKDESQMLLLPNDDIVLGKLTEQAALEQMDMYLYIKLFQKKEEWIANTDRRKTVESLIKYDNEINKKKDIYSNLSYCSAIENAFKAIDKDNLSKLRVLLDVYPILQEKNRRGETLLTAATYKDNYYLAKYLVIRGIKISSLNSECQYPLDIALARGNNNIACMLIKAKGYN